jgi:threonine aldolase
MTTLQPARTTVSPRLHHVIDLRSDTVTRPTDAMRRAIAEASVGDDVLGDDPTVLALQERVAAMMGKEAACFVPSGSMANQTAIRAHTEPGDEVIAHEDSHIIHYETGGPAALSGVMIRPLRGERGLFTPSDVDAAVRPRNAHFARSQLLVLENTHNRGGGSIWPMAQLEAVCERGRAHGLKLHLDGARIWNACAATGRAPSDYARHFDTVSCCFSKGLGAPVGSAVCGDRKSIERVHRFRKMFGGTMRQAGIIAAGALFALEHHRERLGDDHVHAAELARALASMPGVRVPLPVETNIVFFDVDPSIGTAASVCETLKARGVWMLPNQPQRVRAVCHLDVTSAMLHEAIDVLKSVLGAA